MSNKGRPGLPSPNLSSFFGLREDLKYLLTIFSLRPCMRRKTYLSYFQPSRLTLIFPRTSSSSFTFYFYLNFLTFFFFFLLHIVPEPFRCPVPCQRRERDRLLPMHEPRDPGDLPPERHLCSRRVPPALPQLPGRDLPVHKVPQAGHRGLDAVVQPVRTLLGNVLCHGTR